MAASAFADSKPHYAILDGLRGVAALVVIWYHVFEGFATSPLDQKFNHGYLAVDFFFILSGFVVGYAYDDRWKGRPGDASGVRGGMRIRDFLKRRLVRLPGPCSSNISATSSMRWSCAGCPPAGCLLWSRSPAWAWRVMR